MVKPVTEDNSGKTSDNQKQKTDEETPTNTGEETPTNTGGDEKLRLSEEELDKALSGIYDDIKDINDL